MHEYLTGRPLKVPRAHGNTASQGFARYYAEARPYVRRGPPHPLLRLVGPLLIVTTVAPLGSGIWLLPVGPEKAGLLLTVHEGGFVVWFGLTAMHVVGHLRESVVLAAKDWRRATLRRSARGRGPVVMVYQRECGSQSDALKQELAMKRLTTEQKRRLCQ